MTLEGVTNGVVRLAYALVAVTVFTGWFFLGLFFWIPLMARTTVLFTGMAFYDTLVGGQEHVEHGRRALDYAIRFWPEGFGRIRDALDKRGAALGDLPELSAINWQRVIFELFWAVALWAVFIAGFAGTVSKIFG